MILGQETVFFAVSLIFPEFLHHYKIPEHRYHYGHGVFHFRVVFLHYTVISLETIQLIRSFTFVFSLLLFMIILRKNLKCFQIIDCLPQLADSFSRFS